MRFPEEVEIGQQATPVPEGQIAVTSLAPDSPAAEAGLDVGDVLVAIDGGRIDPAAFEKRLRERKIGSTIELTVTRRDRLKTINVVVGSIENIIYSIKEKPDASELQKKIFTSWLAEKKFEP